jgi:hypothetical protein
MLTSNTGAYYMRNTIPDRRHLSDDADTPDQASPAAPKRARLSHRQARGLLALLMDATTEPALAARLRQHVDGCARCQEELEQLRQAEAWLRAQPVEAPQMIATQESAWTAIQARIGAEGAPVPVVGKAHSNGHSHLLDHQASAKAETLVSLAAADDATAGEANHLSQPVPLPQPPAPVTIAPSVSGKPAILSPRRVLFVALAASLVVGSFAALFLAHFSAAGVPTDGLTSTQLFNMGVLDPGAETPAFSFDPVSRRLLALTGAMSYGCPPGAHCPYSGSPCLSFSMLDVGTGKSLSSIRPACAPGKGTLNSITFTDLLDDSPLGEALLVSNNQQVKAVDHRSGAVVRTYSLACCSNEYARPYQTVLDEHDQLLLTAAEGDGADVANTLVAQDAATGKVKYQTALGANLLQSTLVSNVTGWFYMWHRCSMTSDASCVEAYVAESGKKVTSWKAASQQTPLMADPTESLLYVRQDDSNGQSETLVVDGRSGQTVGQLPAAQAMAINEPLHHLYLLDDDGVTVVDTLTRRKLSTLPVLARDESWVAPAVDTATGRVYIPIQRGKLLVAQDNAAGQLRLRSDSLAVVLEAERAMLVDETSKGDAGLYPWELPVGPESSPVYHGMSRGTQSSCEIGWVAARSAATVTKQGKGQYHVQISLAWDDQFAGVALTRTPTPQTSYPHEHTWFYAVLASGVASLSGEQGEEFSHC